MWGRPFLNDLPTSIPVILDDATTALRVETLIPHLPNLISDPRLLTTIPRLVELDGIEPEPIISQAPAEALETGNVFITAVCVSIAIPFPIGYGPNLLFIF